MRQVIVQAPQGQGQEVLAIAHNHHGVNLARVDASNASEALELVLVNISNDRLGGLLEELQRRFPEVKASFAPQETFALFPPADKAAEQVIDVEHRSPLEVFLTGLQSVGSWKGFLGYAAAAGGVVWIGLFTNTIFLLIAAMLIAPFAGPAMNAALATARGDASLLGRSILRYFASLVIAIAVAASLSLLMGQEIATTQMVQVSDISSTAIMLPLIAGAAGALNLCQSSNSSLVSGAATGMLVAASLAPPAGVIGMAIVVQRWDMLQSGIFLLLLQIAGINLAGAIVFRVFGLSPHGARYDRGRGWVFLAGLTATAAALVGLLVWQFWDTPGLQRSSREQRVAALAHKVVNQSGMARMVEANVRFTRADISGQNSLLIVLYVQPTAENDSQPSTAIRDQLSSAIRRQLEQENFDVTPLIDITVLRKHPPPS